MTGSDNPIGALLANLAAGTPSSKSGRITITGRSSSNSNSSDSSVDFSEILRRIANDESPDTSESEAGPSKDSTSKGKESDESEEKDEVDEVVEQVKRGKLDEYESALVGGIVDTGQPIPQSLESGRS
jgi:hypothetical protein